MTCKLLKPTHFHSKISHFQEVPKKFVKECHPSNNNQIDRTKLLLLPISSPTSQNLADLNNFSFFISNKAIFCKKNCNLEKKSKNASKVRTRYLKLYRNMLYQLSYLSVCLWKVIYYFC